LRPVWCVRIVPKPRDSFSAANWAAFGLGRRGAGAGDRSWTPVRNARTFSILTGLRPTLPDGKRPIPSLRDGLWFQSGSIKKPCIQLLINRGGETEVLWHIYCGNHAIGVMGPPEDPRAFSNASLFMAPTGFSFRGPVDHHNVVGPSSRKRE